MYRVPCSCNEKLPGKEMWGWKFGKQMENVKGWIKMSNIEDADL
jgi:hypothetical protein